MRNPLNIFGFAIKMGTRTLKLKAIFFSKCNPSPSLLSATTESNKSFSEVVSLQQTTFLIIFSVSINAKAYFSIGAKQHDRAPIRRSSIKLCIIVQLAAVWTVIYLFPRLLETVYSLLAPPALHERDWTVLHLVKRFSSCFLGLGKYAATFSCPVPWPSFHAYLSKK